MRHLAVAEPCPIDRRPVGRRACSGCSHFVSYRSSPELDTIGCAWGEDTIAWLRREMAPTHRPMPPTRARTGAIVRRPVPPAARGNDGPTLAVMAAAVGLGLLLSAMTRRQEPSSDPRRFIRH